MPDSDTPFQAAPASLGERGYGFKVTTADLAAQIISPQPNIASPWGNAEYHLVTCHCSPVTLYTYCCSS